ncbi:hypothetical protein [Paenibacillus sp. GCM10012306]|uniref:hypothetical protein n=1 Tax=Paenibacillus sp. GCM10012306 TaxID=3317342 RepID=UPI00362035A9
MGFLKGLGSLAGQVVGGVIGGSIEIVGEVTNSNFIKEVGKGVHQTTARTGERLGSLASGTYDVVAGTITGDKSQSNKGLEEVFDTVGNTAKDIGNGIVHVAGKGMGTVEAIIGGDKDKAIELGKDLAKISAIGVLSIGIIDLVEGLDGVDADLIASDSIDVDGLADATSIDIADSDYTTIENPEMHHVTPHWRTLPDGREIFIDGDGDTSINTGTGWNQHNPDYRITKA